MFQFLRRFFRWDAARSRRYKPAARRRRRLGIEPLEQRILLAGDTQTDDPVDRSDSNLIPTDSEQFREFVTNNYVGSRVPGSRTGSTPQDSQPQDTQSSSDDSDASFSILVEEEDHNDVSIHLNPEGKFHNIALTDSGPELGEFGPKLGETEDFRFANGGDTTIVSPQKWKLVAVKKVTSNLDSIGPSVELPSRLSLTSNTDTQQTDSPEANLVQPGYIDVSTVLSSDLANLGSEEHSLAEDSSRNSTSVQSAAKTQSVFLVVAKSSDASGHNKLKVYLTGKRGRSQAFELATSPASIASASIPLELGHDEGPVIGQKLVRALSGDRTFWLTIVPISNAAVGSGDPMPRTSSVAVVPEPSGRLEMEQKTEQPKLDESGISLTSVKCAAVVGLLLAPSAVASVAGRGTTSHDETR